MTGSGYNLIEMTDIEHNRAEEGEEDLENKEEKDLDLNGEVGLDDVGLKISLDTPDLENLQSPSYTSIYKLSREGETEGLRNVLQSAKAKGRINHLDERQCTPLHYAARYSHIGIVKLLLENGAKVDKKGSDGMTPFHYACRYGRNKEANHERNSDPELVGSSTEVLALLRDHDKGKENIMRVKDSYELTGLHHACMRGNLQVVKYLVESKDMVLIHDTDLQGSTALHIAATYGHKEIVQTLIDANADVKLKCKESQNILHRAAEGGQLEVMRILVNLDEFDEMVNHIDSRGMSVLFLAIDGGDLDLIKLLLDRGLGHQLNLANNEPEVPLHSAARTGQTEVVRLILEHTDQIDKKNNMSQTALHLAAENDHLEITELLLENGADHTLRDKNYLTPVMIAALQNHLRIVEVLIGHGARLDQLDRNDHNILHLICAVGNAEILEALLQHESCEPLLNGNDQFDETPLHIAAKNGHVNCVNELFKYDVDIDNKNEDEQSPCHLAAKAGHTDVVKAIIEKDPQCVKDRDEDDNTPLHLAASYGRRGCVKLLLDNNSKTTDQNNKFWTPLDCAAASGCITCAEILLEYGSPVDPVDRKNTTPLHVAAEHGHHQIVELLLNNGADISILDTERCNALEIAISKGKRNAAEVILNSPIWKEALRSTSQYMDERLDTVPNTPMRMLIRTFPDLAEKVFDRCIKISQKDKSALKIMKLDMEFIDDGYNYTKDENGYKYAEIDEEDVIQPNEDPYHDNAAVRMHNHPLMIMVRYKQNNLLRHPLSIALIRQKWKTMGRYIFYVQLLMYLLYLASITSYSLLTLNEVTFEKMNETIADTNSTQVLYDSGVKEARIVLRYLVIIFAGFGILFEIQQFFRTKIRYFSFSNLIDWMVYTVAIGFVWDIPLNISFETCHSTQCWQWPAGAFLLVISWLNILGFLKFFPYFGIFVIMFFDIFKTVAKVSVLIALFIAAFSLGFNILLIEQDAFDTFGWSYLKTFVMTTGEYEYDGIFREHDIPFPAATIILFVAFITVMGIILMNLMVGLAVDDIREIQDNAELKKLSSQVELVLEMEKSFPRSKKQRLIVELDSSPPAFWRAKEVMSKARIWELHGEKEEGGAEDTLVNLKNEMSNMADQMKLLRLEISQMKEGAHTTIL